jgi:hypothetical protein
MPFSIWEYLRERTRDSVLAGFQDALDIVEQGDTNGSQHDAARRLASKLSGSMAGAAEAKSLPHPSVNGEVLKGEPTAPESRGRGVAQEAAQGPADASTFDDELEQRLDAAAAQSGPATAQAIPQTGRRRRGRPPKKSDGNR